MKRISPIRMLNPSDTVQYHSTIVGFQMNLSHGSNIHNTAIIVLNLTLKPRAWTRSR